MIPDLKEVQQGRVGVYGGDPEGALAMTQFPSVPPEGDIGLIDTREHEKPMTRDGNG